MGRYVPEPHDWAITFQKRVREWLLAEDHDPLISCENQLGSEADLAVRRPTHYDPLLYIVGTRMRSEPPTFLVEGMERGSVSMLAFAVRYRRAR